jgi:hypothetical protein
MAQAIERSQMVAMRGEREGRGEGGRLLVWGGAAGLTLDPYYSADA